MFRAFESPDELVQILEEVHSAPLSANYMVPCQHVLESPGELRDAFPTKLDGAQNVLDQRDEIINDTEAWTNNAISSADEEAHRAIDGAEARANHTVENANTHVADTVAVAEDDARHLREDVQHEYDSIVDRASIEFDRLIHAGSESCGRLVVEGREERVRLVAGSTAVCEANGEMNCLLSDAHADSSHLREECDRYIDFKLAGFEQTLQEALCNVGRNHSVLCSDAGAIDGGAGAQNTPSSFFDDQEHRRYERQGIFGAD